MTEEHTGMPQEPERPATPPPTPPEAQPASSTAATPNALEGMFSTGEGMITLGCYIIVGIYLVTGLLMNEYWIPWVVLVPAIAVIILGRLGRDTAEKFAPVPVIIKVLGYLIALFAVLDIIEDIRFASSAFDEFVDVIGSLAFWASAALCFLGARRIDT